ncbi:MAG TPA: hypothetical protein VIK94_01015 [Bacilli bacterium]
MEDKELSNIVHKINYWQKYLDRMLIKKENAEKKIEYAERELEKWEKKLIAYLRKQSKTVNRNNT